jgi:hypothetical protein
MKATPSPEETSLGAACDFGIHLAQRLDISLEAALAQLGEWLVTYRPARRFPIELLDLARERRSSVCATYRSEAEVALTGATG